MTGINYARNEPVRFRRRELSLEKRRSVCSSPASLGTGPAGPSSGLIKRANWPHSQLHSGRQPPPPPLPKLRPESVLGRSIYFRSSAHAWHQQQTPPPGEMLNRALLLRFSSKPLVRFVCVSEPARDHWRTIAQLAMRFKCQRPFVRRRQTILSSRLRARHIQWQAAGGAHNSSVNLAARTLIRRHEDDLGRLPGRSRRRARRAPPTNWKRAAKLAA